MILFTGIPSAYPCFSSVNGRGGNIHDGTIRNVISLSIRMKTLTSAAGAMRTEWSPTSVTSASSIPPRPA